MQSQMKIKTYALSAAFFLSGLLAGGGGMAWVYKREWNQWLMDFSLYPVMAEVTYGLKELRGGNAARLEARLDETAWRNIGTLSQQLANGEAMPKHAEASLRYHCEHNQALSEPSSASVVAARAKLCNQLLAYYAQRT
jgi:hypothetical protein